MGWWNAEKDDTSNQKDWWEHPTISSALQPVQDQISAVIDVDRLERTFQQDPYVWTSLACVGTASFLLGLKIGRSGPGRFRRFTDLASVPSAYVGPDAPLLRGRVVSVSDGDTVRFYHAPSRLFHSSTLDTSQKMSDQALAIRLCTIDTPETAKFGKDGQPFGEEAKNYLKEMVDQKMVHIRLLTKDQYGRGVAELRTGRWPFRTYTDEQMLQAGLAEVYQGGGAVYGHRGKVRSF